MTSTRSNPRLAQSPVALTSLGAVGGARGTAAGALRVFVEFLTTYDKGAAEQLENDLRQLDHAQNNSFIAEQKRQNRLGQVKRSLDEADRIVKGKLNSEQRSALTKIVALEGSRSRTNRRLAEDQKRIFDQVARQSGLTHEEIDLIHQRGALLKEEALLKERSVKADQGQSQRLKDQIGLQGQISKLQAGRASFGPKLAGLAIGAVGGIVGGAILGVGFQLAQTALEGIGESIQDIIDPARHARDAIKELGQEILDIAHNDASTVFEAAQKKAEEIGLGADQASAALLAQFAAQTKVNQSVEDYVKFIQAQAHPDGQRVSDIRTLANELEKTALAQGNLQTKTVLVGTSFQEMTDDQYYLTQATIQYDAIAKQNISTIDEQVLARRRLAEATAFATIQQQALTDALNTQASAETAAVDKKIDALSDVGDSPRTKRLQAALDNASGGGGNSNAAALRNNAEERQILLLRQRLALMGDNINLEKYSGKFLLEAINAKIAALQKQGQEQARLNQLLALQFKMSQNLKRNQGESINDFLERRAQEGRENLAALDQIRRDQQIDALNARKDQVEAEVALAENAQARLDILNQQGTSSKIKALQKQLEASKKADKAALDSKKKALEAEKEAIKKKYDEAIALSKDQATQETIAALQGAKSLEDLAFFQGRISGLLRAKGALEGLVSTGLIPKALVAPFLSNIDKQLSAFNKRQNLFTLLKTGSDFGSLSGRGGYAKGGVIDLMNSRSPFGQNVRTGEEGSEIGVILSNKVARILKEDRQGGHDIDVNLYRVNDSWRDKHMVGSAIKQALSEL